MDTQVFQDSQVADIKSRLRCWQGYAFAMPGPHRHDDIEVNLVAEAPLAYLFGGTPVEIQPGQVGVFWAAMPHRLIDCPENWSSRVSWLHLPLDIVLKWGLAEDAVSLLLRGIPIIADARDAARMDEADFAQWSVDLDRDSEELRAIALLEIQARIRRLVNQALSIERTGLPELSDISDSVRHAAAMARYAATHFRNPIGAADVAATVHLHPNYAMTLFRKVVGVTLGTYLTQCRLAEAQRLLITTRHTTNEIAVASGFGSQSAFYATFTRTCGLSPGAYRRTFR